MKTKRTLALMTSALMLFLIAGTVSATMGNTNANQQRTRAQSVEEAQQFLQVRNQEMEQERIQYEEPKQEIYQNQDQTRLGVYGLDTVLDMVNGNRNRMEELIGQVEDSVDVTIPAEEKIQSRSGFTKFFMGGDKEAAGEILQQVNANRERLQNLNQLQNECQECDEPLKQMMQEQIRNIEQEQNRLEDVANQEHERKGLFGWLFGWLTD